MSDLILMTLIQSATAVIVIVVTALIRKWFSAAKKDVLLVKEKVETVHTQINSRMDQLLEVTGKASKAEGKVEGIAETKAEIKNNH